jgi:hypothetical protein
MRRQDGLLVAMCVGTIAFAIAFVYPQFTGQALVWYFPVERRWAYEAQPDGLAIDFYGRLAQAIVAWAVAVVVSMAVTRRVATLPPRIAALLTAWAIAITLFVMLYFAWTLAVRVPQPMPLPSWYEPR